MLTNHQNATANRAFPTCRHCNSSGNTNATIDISSDALQRKLRTSSSSLRGPEVTQAWWLHLLQLRCVSGQQNDHHRLDASCYPVLGFFDCDITDSIGVSLGSNSCTPDQLLGCSRKPFLLFIPPGCFLLRQSITRSGFSSQFFGYQQFIKELIKRFIQYLVRVGCFVLMVKYHLQDFYSQNFCYSAPYLQ